MAARLKGSANEDFLNAPKSKASPIHWQGQSSWSSAVTCCRTKAKELCAVTDVPGQQPGLEGEPTFDQDSHH